MNYHLDYETFSAIDLTVVGAYRYAEDPSTEVLMFSISSDEEGPYLWIPRKYRSVLASDPRADRLITAILPTDCVWAHSATFEVAVSRYRWIADVGLPWTIGLAQWRCTALLGRLAAMPAKLERLALALGLKNQKDPKGKALIKVFSVLQEDGKRILPKDRPAEFKQFGEYCLQDNRTEREIHSKLKVFEPRGLILDAWLFDLRMNDRGFPVNRVALQHAQALIKQGSVDVFQEFYDLTGLMPTQNKKMRVFLADKGLDMEDLQADTVEEKLGELSPNHKAYRALWLYSQVQFAAVKKVKAMLDCVCSDGYIRGMMLFYGAHTGRWSGRGVQPQNFKRPTIKGPDVVYRQIREKRPLWELELIHGNPIDAISSCIRNFIQPHTGLVNDADYNAIEARIICWLAGQQDRLADWAKGVDQYKWMAGMVYGVPMDTIINPSDRREVGKRVILGCGFGMAAEKFRKTCKDQYGLDVPMDLCEKGVTMYRQTHRKVKGFWWLCQQAAINSIKQPGTVFNAGKYIRFFVATINGTKFLFAKLPSGRNIAYPEPEVRRSKKFEDALEVTFMTEKKNQWMRVGTYGGKLAENVTQGVAADIMMNGGVKAEAAGAEIFMLVHDQAPAHATIPLDKYVAALTDLPSWASGLPIKAEGRVVPYYKK